MVKVEPANRRFGYHVSNQGPFGAFRFATAAMAKSCWDSGDGAMDWDDNFGTIRRTRWFLWWCGKPWLQMNPHGVFFFLWVEPQGWGLIKRPVIPEVRETTKEEFNHMGKRCPRTFGGRNIGQPRL